MKPKSDAAKPYYQMTAQEQGVATKYLDRLETDITLPRIKVVKTNKGSMISPDHPDEFVGQVLLMQALGTADPTFANGLIRQLAEAGSQGSQIDERETNFLLSIIEGYKPKDQPEAMLATQMAAIHNLAMKLARRLALAETLPEQDSAERALNKLARTFATQMETLKRYRAGSEQTVNVQHVSVSEGGQAIVGNVTQTTCENAPDKPAAASPLALPDARATPMPIMDKSEERAVVPARDR
jgi:hypothetical protein